MPYRTMQPITNAIAATLPAKVSANRMIVSDGDGAKLGNERGPPTARIGLKPAIDDLSANKEEGAAHNDQTDVDIRSLRGCLFDQHQGAKKRVRAALKRPLVTCG